MANQAARAMTPTFIAQTDTEALLHFNRMNTPPATTKVDLGMSSMRISVIPLIFLLALHLDS
jgi:hypothetical protein